MPAPETELGFSQSGILDRIRNTPVGPQLQPVLFDVARAYAPYLGINFDNDVLPNLGDHAWWSADYGVSEIDGRAIGMSVKDSFRCLVDTHRTIQIAHGIKETVDYLKKHRSGPLTAIDAGTGTGILSILLAAYGVDQVTAIEFNHETFEHTSDLLRDFKLDRQINIVEGDATQIDLATKGIRAADILVSENLSGGLMDEPQYDIIAHLSQYLATDAKIIPFSASLSVAIANADWEGVDSSDWVGVDPKDAVDVQARKLKKCTYLSGYMPYAHVESHVGMDVPIIRGLVNLPLEQRGPINTIVVSTDFQINEVGEPAYLYSGAAEFLGKQRAFKVIGEVQDSDKVSVDLKYRVGVMGKYIHTTANGTSIFLND